MALIADGLLITTCLTTALYCFVLSQRLKKLTSTEDGIGQQILQMNAALDETRDALKDLRGTSKSSSERLAREVANAKRIAGDLQALLASAEVVSQRSYKDAAPAEPIAATIIPDAVEPESPPQPDFDDSDLEDLGGFDGEEQLGFAPDSIGALPDSSPPSPPKKAEPAPAAAPSDGIESLRGSEAVDGAPAFVPGPTRSSAAESAETLIKVERMAL